MRLVVVGLMASLMAPAAARACAEAVSFERVGPQLVADAEQALERGDLARATELIGPRRRARLFGETPALDRRMRLLRAVLRLRELRQAPVPVAQNHAVFVALASEIEALRKEDKESPYVDARWAEALTAAGSDDKAMVLLADLAARDLMPDAQAWATLAELRARAVDIAGRDRALAECRKIAARRSVCVIGPTPSAARAER